jgi:RNA polymerase sigma factor (sigma-70 family)
MNDFDVGLVKSAREGSMEGYAQLIRKYSNLVFATALGKINDFYHAEDISQEVFVKAWFKLTELKEPEKFVSWLLTMTTNSCKDWFRKKYVSEEQLVMTEKLNQYGANHNLENHVELKMIVWKALNELDEKYRVVAIMHLISGYKAKEISQIMNISLSAVESRLRRAKDKLKEELYDQMSETVGEKKLGIEFEDEVMWRIVPRIATIEIPVSNLDLSISWYSKFLGTKVIHQDPTSAMLMLQGGNRIGVPTLYLVQTNDANRLSFKNTNTNTTHSVIDFFLPHLDRFHSFLTNENVEVTGINYIEGTPGYGGFGFKDPDGNSLSVCNVTFRGQE